MYEKRYCEKCKNEIIKKRCCGIAKYSKIRFCSYKCRGEVLRGDKHQNWKGESVNRVSKHAYLINNYGTASVCDNREKQIFEFKCNGKYNKFDYAIKHNTEYSKNIDDYYRLCRSCHKKYDLQKGWKGSSTSFKKGDKPKWTGGKRPNISGINHHFYGKPMKEETKEKLRMSCKIAQNKRREREKALKNNEV